MWFGPLLQGGAQALATVVLVGANASQAASSSTGAVVQTHALVGASATQAASCTTGAIGQTHALVAAPSVQDATAAASAIVQMHVLAAAACTGTAISSSVAIGGGTVEVFAPRPGGMPAALAATTRAPGMQQIRRGANLQTARRPTASS